MKIRAGLSLVLLTASVLGEIAGVGGWLARQGGLGQGPAWEWPLGLVVHLGAVGLGLGAFSIWSPLGQGRFVRPLVLLTGLFFPVAGLPGVILLVFLVKIPWFKRQVGPGYKELTSHQHPIHDEIKPIEDVVSFLLNELSVEPVADLIGSDDPDIRRGAVEVLRRIKNPYAIRLLKQTQRDTNPEVRIYANTALIRLDKEMTDAIEAAATRVRRKPNDAESLLTQAEAIMAYYLSGLLDDESRDFYLDLAETPARKLLALESGNPDVQDLWGRICLLKGNPVEAQLAFERSINTNGHATSGRLGLAEALYDQGRFEQLPSLCADLVNGEDNRALDDQNLLALRMWTDDVPDSH